MKKLNENGKVNNKQKYVSIININGVPILPPLITSDKSKEMCNYRKQAIKIEKRINREKELRNNINQFNKLQLSHNKRANDYLQSVAVDECNLLVDKNAFGDYVSKTSKFTCDVQVSQYANNEFKIFAIDKINEKKSESPKHKLIRSNSYTIETPSPELVQHLKNNVELSSSWGSLINVHEMSKTPAKIETDLVIISSDLNDESYLLDTSCTESELKDICSNATSDNKYYDLLNEAKLKEFFDNNVPSNDKDLHLNETITNKTQIEHETSDSQELQMILNNIPEEYSKQIMELLDKQKLEALERLKTIEQLSIEKYSTAFDGMKVNPEKYSTPNEVSPELINSMPNSGHSLYYSTIGSFSDVAVDEGVEKSVELLPQNDALNETYCNDSFLSKSKQTHCGRKLFPDNDLNKQRIMDPERAATVLGAATRGYLTRRLMRTERVQSLIQTIQDALMCAMELHTETMETIAEADVELHRRCIQQVSAACEAFHDVFFHWSIPEQMSLITVDRQKLIDKLRRPFSAISGISSNKSTPRSTRSNKPFSSRSTIRT